MGVHTCNNIISQCHLNHPFYLVLIEIEPNEKYIHNPISEEKQFTYYCKS